MPVASAALVRPGSSGEAFSETRPPAPPIFTLSPISCLCVNFLYIHVTCACHSLLCIVPKNVTMAVLRTAAMTHPGFYNVLQLQEIINERRQ